MSVFTSCDLPQIENPYAPTKQSMANEVTNQAFIQLKMEKNLFPFGTGSGMMDEIWMLALAFQYFNLVEIDQARELLMSAGTVFINIINSKEQIRPFLKNYPFTPKNVEIQIFIKKPNGSRPDSGQLNVVTMKEGILRYKVRDPDNDLLKIVYEETYEEAAEKLRMAITM